jgi:lipopolysaccharide/colanic/teichoic acid biosynthesis glycosyltransferase
VSSHSQSTTVFASAEIVDRALAELPSVIDFLPAGSEAAFAPVNTNEDWSCGAGKRALDLLIAVPVLALLAPFFAMLALLIRLDSKGPVFFRQTRAGQCGRNFEILKFRTMHVLENGDTIVQARQGDPRVTRIGSWLRR